MPVVITYPAEPSRMLFSQAERTDASPRSYRESRFQYLDRAARPEACQVRELLEDWLAQYPSEHRQALERRIRSGKNDQFYSATSELYVHRLLIATSHQVEVEPQLSDTSKRPDFLATRGESRSLFEVTLSTELSANKRASDARLNDLYDAINTISSPDYFLSLDIDGAPLSPIPARRDWITRIRHWLGTLNYDHVVRLGADLRNLPTLTLGADRRGPSK